MMVFKLAPAFSNRKTRLFGKQDFHPDHPNLFLTTCLFKDNLTFVKSLFLNSPCSQSETKTYQFFTFLQIYIIIKITRLLLQILILILILFEIINYIYKYRLYN